MKKRWCVMISGTGSNLNALLNSGANIALVISSSSNAFGLLKARRYGIPTIVLSQPIVWGKVLEDLEHYRIDNIFLAGFMKIVPESFLKSFWGAIVNLHPSLLPKYPGLDSIQKAFQKNDELGCTVHHVIPVVDSGEIILQRHVQTFSTLEDSEFMVHISEQRLVTEAVKRC